MQCTPDEAGRTSGQLRWSELARPSDPLEEVQKRLKAVVREIRKLDEVAIIADANPKLFTDGLAG